MLPSANSSASSGETATRLSTVVALAVPMVAGRMPPRVTVTRVNRAANLARRLRGSHRKLHKSARDNWKSSECRRPGETQTARILMNQMLLILDGRSLKSF